MTTTAKIKKWFDFDWLKKTELVELHEVDCSQDPVRPELDIKFRTSHGRKIYGLKHGEDIMAVMCFAFTNQVPKTVEEMDRLSYDAAMQAVHRAGIQGNIAIAYTVWSLKKGGGKMIVKEVYKMIKKSNHLNRLVTLSPLTKMAEKFHLRNGARLIQKNESTQNFEYVVLK
jgi:hypothetical protein|tara:strand:- start:75 stop:587 length:513 start_codon:yes stop_codon:yes gene_type:complete